ncbi:MAG: ribosome biogenesis GTP-binding protein YihA/YsxC [bacterium]|nr:ribosome biogenesis GTP-binding protein YihA/YsxC [bacterium]
MKITSAKFIKGAVGTDEIFENGIPQIAFIGRSNAGKSSVINSLVSQKGLARTSSRPGLTQEINLYLINKSFYLVDLPGYGFARLSLEVRDWMQKVINWYLFKSTYDQKLIVLIIDGSIGPTENDLEMILGLEEKRKNVVIVANKIDKVKKSKYESTLREIQEKVGDHIVIPYSAEKNIGVTELRDRILEQ